MSLRFRDYQTRLSDFEQDVLVKCPQCECCACSTYLEDRLIWQVSCIQCGYSQTSKGKLKKYGAAIDPVFGLPLWLQVSCCSKVLWAYNAAHLKCLEQYVQANLRERQGDRGNHHSLAVQLPRWMKLANHRQLILKGIQRLKARLE